MTGKKEDCSSLN